MEHFTFPNEGAHACAGLQNRCFMPATHSYGGLFFCGLHCPQEASQNPPEDEQEQDTDDWKEENAPDVGPFRSHTHDRLPWE